MEQSSNKVKKNTRTRGNGHGTIFMNKQRKSWVAEIYDIHGIRRRSSFKKKVDAETWLVTQKQARDRGEGLYALHVKQTVAEFLVCLQAGLIVLHHLTTTPTLLSK
jgi:hypothetical protein